jgi:integrating conjugative element protein (TIGR03756 family)
MAPSRLVRIVCLSLWAMLPATAWSEAAGSASGSASGESSGVTSAKLIAATFAGAATCLQWTPVGVCFWMTCGPYGCSVHTSIKIRHFAPDLAVSTFHDPARHPWTDYGRPLALAARGAASGLLAQANLDSAGTRSKPERTDKNTRFRDADAIGHPSIQAGLGASGGDMLCRQTTTAFRPYLLSQLDAWVWRNYWPVESLYLASWIPGMREIGDFPFNTWSGVYPRTGWLLQQHDVKASAVIAQRVGDIVTRSGESHVYMDVPHDTRVDRGSQMVWNPPSLVERQPLTGQFQMQYPIPSPECVVFGNNDSLKPASYGDGKTTADSGYVWALWRPYRCCRRAGHIFLFSIGE